MTATTRTTPPAWNHPTARSRGDELAAFRGALRSESMKLASLRSTKGLIALTLAVNLLTSWAVAMWATDEVLVVSRVFVYPGVFTAVIAAIAGSLMLTAEAQHGTLAIALTAQPARWVIAASKATIATAGGLVLAAVGMTAGAVAAIAVGLPAGDTSAVPATASAALLFTALAAVLGLGVGMIVRSTAGAISGLLVWWFVAENLILRLAPVEVGRFLPFDAGTRLLQVGGAYNTPAVLDAQLARPQLALVFGAYAAAAMVSGTLLLYRRDTK
jgi:ABC-2 type transport system permease protein